ERYRAAASIAIGQRGWNSVPPMRARVQREGTRATDRLRFKPVFRVEVVPPEGVYLISERARHVLKGEANCRLAPYLDGSASEREIVDHLEGVLSPLEVLSRLDLLEQRGYIERVDGSGPDDERAFWDG